jgi:hypothetical protein
MDLGHYRQREQQERALAAQARNRDIRAAHLNLAERYRAVIQAYEQLEKVVPANRNAA